MNKIIEDELIEGLHVLVGVNKKLLKDYVSDNDIRHILDHPAALGMDARQTEKLYQLKDFINAYSILRAEAEDEEISCTQKAKDLFLARMGYHCEYESVMAVFLDTKEKIISCEVISQGSVNCSIILPQKIAKRAILLDATSVIVGHNHPSLSTTPSMEDISVTKNLLSGLRLLDIRLLDHIIVGGNQALSMLEKGIVDFKGDLDIDDHMAPTKEKLEQSGEEEQVQTSM